MKSLIRFYSISLFVFGIYLFPLLTFSQGEVEPIHLFGQVLDEEKTPIMMGEARLLKAQDSSLIQAGFFEEGHLDLRFNFKGKALLKIRVVGYKDYYQRLEIRQKDQDLGRIFLVPALLKGVEILSLRSAVVKKGDNLLVKVEGSALEHAGTALDVLRNSPNLRLNSANQLTVVGKGQALIYLDGQLIPGTDFLQNIPSNEIEALEIIENPSAKFDAAGQAVILIRTKTNRLDSFKLRIGQEFGYGRHARGKSSVNLLQKLSKWTLQFNYGFRPIEYNAMNYYGRTYVDGQKQIEIDNKYDFRVKQATHSYELKAHYQVNDRNSVSIQYAGSQTKAQKVGLNKNIYEENFVPLFGMKTEIEGPFFRHNQRLTAFYEKQLDTLGSHLVVSGQYALYDQERIENIHQLTEKTGSLTTLDRRTFNLNHIELMAGQVDLHKYFNADLSSSFGIKNALINNQSLLHFEGIKPNGDYFLIPEGSTDYAYQENITSLYSQLGLKKASWSAQLGLRAEATLLSGQSENMGETPIFSRRYFNVFPSLSLNRDFSKTLNLSLQYNYRIGRPSFQDLNPFSFYVDSLVSFRGNPYLLPSYSHNLSTGLNYKKFSMGLNFTHTLNEIKTLIEILDPNQPAIFDFKRDNIVSTRLLAANFSYPIQTKRYTAFFSLRLRSETHTYLDEGEIKPFHQPGFYFSSAHTFLLPRQIKLEINYWYNSKQVDGIYLDNPVSMLNLAVSKQFLKQSLLVRLSANDVLNKYQFKGIASVYGNQWTYLSAGEYRFVQLSLNWSFGKSASKRLGNRQISEEELRRMGN